jgi:uracil phosphoribosyltransferase
MAKPFVLSHQPNIANQIIAELRDVNVQSDRAKFRLNLKKIGQLLAYEISKELVYESVEIQTVLAKTQQYKLERPPVIITILRASLPFTNGILHFFDQSDVAFIGAYRRNQGNATEIEVDIDYLAAPDINGRDVIIADPMLATGKSICKTVHNILALGHPKSVHLAAAIAAPEGLSYLEKNLKVPYKVWLGELDEKLNDKAYIVPGLGDAGDLSFGTKS